MDQTDSFSIHDEMLYFTSIAIGGNDGFSLEDFMDYKLIVEKRDKFHPTKRFHTVFTDIMMVPVKHRNMEEELMFEDAISWTAEMSYDDNVVLTDRYVGDFLKEHRNDVGIRFSDAIVDNRSVRNDYSTIPIRDTIQQAIAHVPLSDPSAFRVYDKIKTINLL